MKNVKWLVQVSLTMLNIWCEQVVIWLLIPLREKKHTVKAEVHTVKRKLGHAGVSGV